VRIEQMHCPQEKRVTANMRRTLRSVTTYLTAGVTVWVCLYCGEPRLQFARRMYASPRLDRRLRVIQATVGARASGFSTFHNEYERVR